MLDEAALNILTKKIEIGINFLVIVNVTSGIPFLDFPLPEHNKQALQSSKNDAGRAESHEEVS